MEDSKSDDVAFLDRRAGWILIWAIVISLVLRVIAYMISPTKEQVEEARKQMNGGTEGEIGIQVLSRGMASVLIELLAVLVSFFGKLLALVGFLMRGADRERRRRACSSRRQLHSSVHASQDGAD